MAAKDRWVPEYVKTRSRRKPFDVTVGGGVVAVVYDREYGTYSQIGSIRKAGGDVVDDVGHCIQEGKVV